MLTNVMLTACSDVALKLGSQPKRTITIESWTGGSEPALFTLHSARASGATLHESRLRPTVPAAWQGSGATVREPGFWSRPWSAPAPVNPAGTPQTGGTARSYLRPWAESSTSVAQLDRPVFYCNTFRFN